MGPELENRDSETVFVKRMNVNAEGDHMIHTIRAVRPLPFFRLCVQFSEGVTKIYHVTPWFEKSESFQSLKNPKQFCKVKADRDGQRVIWNDETGLSCDELFENGHTIETCFDGLISFSDATKMWDLNESTLRKAVAYGKLLDGVDACNFGRQWVVSVEAMKREYGEPKM